MKKTKPKSKFVLFSIFLGLLVILTILFTIELTSKGNELLKYEEEKKAFQIENRELTSLLISNTSLVRIKKKAEELGMVKPEKVIYLIQEELVAKFQ